MANDTEPEERSLINALVIDPYLQRNYSLQNSTPTIYEDNDGDLYQFTQSSEAEKILLDFIYILDEFGVPTLLALGVVLNIFVAVTIRQSELKKISSCCYLYSLAIVDSIYLVVMAIPWLSLRFVDIYNMKGFCQLVYYFSLLTTFLSSWYVVLLLFERLVICYRPDTAKRYFNAFRTKCYITAMSIFSIVGHLYLTWTSGVFYFPHLKRNLCTVVQENYQDIIVMRKIDTVLSFILPVLLSFLLVLPLIIFLCASNFKCTNGILRVRTRVITVEVRLNSKRKRKRYQECPSCSEERERDLDKQRLLTISESRRVTMTTIIIALVYVILAIPHNIIKSKMAFLNGDYIVTPEDSTLLKLFEDLFNINFVHKGLVYFLLLPEMRKNLANHFVSCFKKKKPPEDEEQNMKVIVTTL